MQYKTLGRTGFDVSTISFGAWAIGGRGYRMVSMALNTLGVQLEPNAERFPVLAPR